jgi:digeranylgeranylglycerophospholipid reductase
MSDFYDVIIAGGSISGLLAAREIASAGLSVAVLEEDAEVGSPEHCGGLVSIGALETLGVVPSDKVIQNHIKYARILSSSYALEFNAAKQKAIVIDRRMFDKQIAFQAQKLGAEIKIRCSMHSISEIKASVSHDSHYILKSSEGTFACNYFVDARGVTSIIQRDREGILQSAQYEVYAPWIEGHTVEVQIDCERYPGFFAWIIPTGSEKGKVGVAGRSINAAKSLVSYMDSKGEKYSVIRKVYAPIWIKGPIENFVIGRTMITGDAAGQTKPTTAGGIYTCGIGGMLAGRALIKSVRKSDDSFLHGYEKAWSCMFKREFEKLLLMRKVLERLDNRAVDGLFSMITRSEIKDIASTVDFDFHSTALLKILLGRNRSKVIKTILGNEMRRLLNI